MRAPARESSRSVSLLRLLANEKRLEIARIIIAGEISVGALAEKVGLSQSALSQHLALFRAVGAANTRRDAQTIYYSTSCDDIRRIVALADMIGDAA